MAVPALVVTDSLGTVDSLNGAPHPRSGRSGVSRSSIPVQHTYIRIHAQGTHGHHLCRHGYVSHRVVAMMLTTVSLLPFAAFGDLVGEVIFPSSFSMCYFSRIGNNPSIPPFNLIRRRLTTRPLRSANIRRTAHACLHLVAWCRLQRGTSVRLSLPRLHLGSTHVHASFFFSACHGHPMTLPQIDRRRTRMHHVCRDAAHPR